MSLVKSFAVGNGDIFYIQHQTDNFSPPPQNLWVATQQPERF